MANRLITYKFEFEDGISWSYRLEFDENFRLVSGDSSARRPWTRLDFCKCPNCPLSGVELCPVAANVDRIIEDSKETASIKSALVTVETPERTFTKKCAAQVGLFSLFGLVMASSACPHLDWLRPMARFHLPFSTADETLYRVLGLQLMTEFFSGNGSGKDTVTLIDSKYAELQTVNHAFIKRIRAYCSGDADKNAIAALDVFVQMFAFQKADNFGSIRKYFGGRP